MTIRLEPHGRTSVSNTGVFHARGANHCMRSNGSMHAWYTISRAELMMSVDTSYRYEEEVIVFSSVVGFELMASFWWISWFTDTTNEPADFGRLRGVFFGGCLTAVRNYTAASGRGSPPRRA